MFRLLGFISTRIAPVGVVLYNHLYVQDEGWNLTLVAWILLAIILYFTFLKPMNEKTKMWEYQEKNLFFVLNYKHIKLIILFSMLWFLWVSLHSDYEAVYNTLLTIMIFQVFGWVFSLLGFKVEEEETN